MNSNHSSKNKDNRETKCTKNETQSNNAWNNYSGTSDSKVYHNSRNQMSLEAASYRKLIMISVVKLAV